MRDMCSQWRASQCVCNNSSSPPAGTRFSRVAGIGMYDDKKILQHTHSVRPQGEEPCV